MEEKRTPVGREALYEEVWRDPMTTVAPRYGLSDVGLVKICKSLLIPVPGRGYWAKLQVGRPTRQPPLPALPPGMRAPHGPSPLSEREAALRTRVQEAVAKIRKDRPPMNVPTELADPLPLVLAAAQRLKQSDGWDHPGALRSAPKEVLDVQATRDTLDRALRLMDTLLKALRRNGFAARVDPEKGRTLLDGAGTTLKISIVEQITRTNHLATPGEERALKRHYQSSWTGSHSERPGIPHFDWHPTGLLTLTVGEWPSRKWNDTHRSLMDRRLAGIVAAVIGLADAKHAKEVEEGRRRQAYQEAKARYEAQVRMRTHERRKLRDLFRDVSRLRRANDMRELITAVEARARRNGEFTPEKQQWIAWANDKADWVDPLMRRTDPILDTPEPEEPSYWQFK